MTPRSDHYHIILLSAGSGTRMGTSEKKQFLSLNGSPLFVWAVRAFLTLIEDCSISLYLTHSPGDLTRFRDLLSEHLNPDHVDLIRLIEGGSTRSESVYHALREVQATANSSDIVLIHDCARPFIQKADIDRLMDTLCTHKAATLGYSITDTFKKVDSPGQVIVEHIDRDTLRGILTPQGFRFDLLWQAYEAYMKSPYPVTDDTELVEALGIPVTVVESDRRNIKITRPDDLTMAELYIELLPQGDGDSKHS